MQPKLKIITFTIIVALRLPCKTSFSRQKAISEALVTYLYLFTNNECEQRRFINCKHHSGRCHEVCLLNRIKKGLRK